MRSRRSGRWTGAVAAALAVVLLGPGATVPGAAAPVRVAGPPGAGLVAGCETFGFTAMPAVAGVAAPRDVEAVDTNQNGFDDLLVASASGDGDVHQLIAVGNGTFRTSVGPGAPPEVYPAPGTPRAVTVGYFNRDAKPDYAVATTDGVGVWFGAAGGDPGFGPGGRVLAGRSVADVAVADFDRDLLPDLAALDPEDRTDRDDDRVRVFRNLNGGSFDQRFLLGDQPTYVQPDFLAAGDLTGNGVPDLLVSSRTQGTVSVIRDGANSPAPRVEGIGEAWKPAIADFDLDGRLDAAVAIPGEDRIRLWSDYRDPPSGGFPPAPRELPSLDLGPLTPGREGPHDVDVADVNRDGRPDLVVVGYASRAVYVFPGRGDGTFGTPAVLAAGSQPVQAAVGRFDNNQSLDVAVLDEVDNTLRVYLNTCTAPGPNLTAGGLEVTQVIQDLGNSVDLVADRRTVVRAYVGTDAQTPAVTAALHGFRADGTSLGPPLAPANPGRLLVPDRTVRRGQLGGGFLFELPTQWTSEGQVRLRVEINPDRRVTEPDHLDNVTERTVRFQASQPVRVKLIRFGYQRDGQTVLPPESDLDRAESLLRRTLPTSRLEVTRADYRDDHPFFWIGDDSFFLDAQDARSVLDRYRQATAGTREPGVYHLVMVNRDRMGGIAENIPGWVAVGGAHNPTTILHELGHLLGAGHVECTDNPGDETGPRSYPYPRGTIGGPDPANPGFAGYDIGDASVGAPRRIVWAPDTSPPVADLMSYCRNTWVSDDLWRLWRNRVQNPPAQQGATGDLLALSGAVGDGTATLTGQRLTRTTQRPATTPGPYALRLLDAAGATLAEHPFTPAATEHAATRPFHEVVDFAPGTRRVTLVDTRAGRDLATLPVSANPPVVALAGEAPPASVPATGPVTVGWSAGDADGGPVTASVLYSPDGADDWRVLATGLTGTSYTLDAAQLAGTGGAATGRLRVRVTDGVHTADATSGPLTVAGKNPAVRITAPMGGTFFATGQTVTLAASVTDPEQGDLDGAAVRWTSDRDGDLGTGATRTPGQLSEGRHVLTVTATDADGLRATVRTEVTVGRVLPAGGPPTADAGPDRTAVEGDTVTLDATRTTDPDGDPVTLSWTVLAQPEGGGLGGGLRLEGPARTPSFRADRAGTYRLELTATDARHGTATDTVTVTVANRPIEVSPIALDEELRVAGPVTVRATFTDPGVPDTHRCAVDWDGGGPAPATPGVVSEDRNEGGCVATGDLRPGVHVARLTVTGDDGGTGQQTVRIVVYDPSDVTVAGAGAIVSPAGALSADVAATGPGEFAFVAGLVKGSPTPFGATTFRLPGREFTFAGTTHERLTVAGSVGRYQGEGTVNGRPGYAYQLTVADAPDGRDVDRFRIRIWESDGGRVVYDSGRGAPDDLDPAHLQPLNQGRVVVVG
ncbi:FG-GAP-like repeat-containing protein [Micromonospora aurantiaca]|uniref:FG-GAP repeat domain-containing protein n=1 Tax=Micromonospora aurantiaca (nom. illeg.) TaxID=47850 RepID=UPI000827A35D|nr:VCBS repeat-containing protein [Micromonospora aurantiaca]SCL22406.1 Repeat domain-containing protein [Micromonospora aurantiaca]